MNFESSPYRFLMRKFPKVISKWGTGCLKNPLADCSHCGTLKKSFAPQKKGRAEIFLEAYYYDPI